MIASLAMYDRPETAHLTDTFWQGLRDHLRHQGIPSPDTLTRDPDLWAIWTSPHLLLGQTCSLPFRARLHPHLTLLGNPDLGLPETPPGQYHSVIVTRRGAADDPAARRRLAFNDPLSQSGWAAPVAWAAHLGLAFTDLLETGAHRDSAAAVADGRADIAAIDAHSWRLLLAHDTAITDRLQVIARTDPTPALPYVTAFPELAGPLRAALAAAIAGHGAPLGLQGLVQLPLSAHLCLPLPPDPWADAGKSGHSVASHNG